MPPTPYEETAGDRLPVLVSVDISNILELKQLEGLWQLKFNIELLWYDQRLYFQNLKEDYKLNILADEERRVLTEIILFILHCVLL